MLHGLLGVLCFFLLVLVVRLCKKSKSKKETVQEIQIESLVQMQPENRQSYETISESATRQEVYRPLESEYDEIGVKQHNSPVTDERPTHSTCNPGPSHRTIDSDIQENDFRVEKNTEQFYLSANKSDSVDLETSIMDRNAYIDAI